MPELPEVETIKSDLAKLLKNKIIKSIAVKRAKFLNMPIAKFQKALISKKIKNIQRRAKVLILAISDNTFLLIHLKLTGQLIYMSANGNKTVGGHSIKKGLENLPNKYTHLIFEFTDKSKLYYNDLRQFGWLKLLTAQKLKDELVKFGPEPLSRDLTLKAFRQILKQNPCAKIKPFLMNQQKIAGIGNIYADEICFCAKIMPSRLISNLSALEQKKLFFCIKKILQKAVAKRGSSVQDYLDANGQKGGYVPHIKVYGREKQKCKICGMQIQKTKLAQRGTHFCPKCQK